CSSSRRHTRFKCDWSSDVCSSDLRSVRAAIRSPGQPLAGSLRRGFEAGFGWDFASVRIHHGDEADAAARALGALAFTYGRHVSFRAGRFAPDSAGRALLAHELAHVVQQSGGTARLQRKEDPDEKPKKTREPPRATGKYFSVKVTKKLTPHELLIELASQYFRVGPKEAAEIASHWSWVSDVPEVSAAQIAAKSYVVDVSNLSVPGKGAAQGKRDVADGPGKKMAVDPQAGKDEATLLRKAVGGLPADVRDFLFEGAPAVEPEDMKTVLAIAAKIATLTPDQRLEYKARTSAVAADWQAYGK